MLLISATTSVWANAKKPTKAISAKTAAKAAQKVASSPATRKKKKEPNPPRLQLVLATDSKPLDVLSWTNPEQVAVKKAIDTTSPTWIAQVQGAVVMQVKPRLLINGMEVTLKESEGGVEKDKTKANKDKRFVFDYSLPALDQAAPLQIQIISPEGKEENVSYQLVPKRNTMDRWYLYFGAGPTFLLYDETGVESFTQIQMTGKVAFQFWIFPKKLDLMANIFSTLYPLVNSSSSLKGWFLGWNVRAGYTIPWPRAPFAWRVGAGVYSTNLFCQGGSCGFRYLMGFPLSTDVSYLLASKHRLGLSFKFSPQFNDVGSLSFASRELGGGLSYTRELESTRAWSLSLDVAQLLLQFEQEPVTISSTSFSLGFGFRY